jgi:hypothetical protein
VQTPVTVSLSDWPSPMAKWKLFGATAIITACCPRCRASARLLHQYILTTTLLMMFAASSTRSALLLKCR